MYLLCILYSSLYLALHVTGATYKNQYSHNVFLPDLTDTYFLNVGLSFRIVRLVVREGITNTGVPRIHG
jgi:hypothetical protein